ncbi:MAG: hypothetical protein WBH20_05150, partial [Oceanisphaera sp.]|uniref:hypothetical protein n=1 Tax=Oceanisphaera sp. TaxID=1929979 RepID=UPI003C722329
PYIGIVTVVGGDLCYLSLSAELSANPTHTRLHGIGADKGIDSTDHHMTGRSCADHHKDVLAASLWSGPFVRSLHEIKSDHLFSVIGVSTPDRQLGA